ncbi:Hypothetical protein in type-1 retrotransposable element R1DM, partial [Stegodyphus mimosarum]
MDGNVTSSLSNSISAIMTKHFPCDNACDDRNCHRAMRNESEGLYISFTDCEFSTSEVNTVINNLKKNKSPGPDSLPNEIIQYFHAVDNTFLLRLFNYCLSFGVFPTQWKKAWVVLIPKTLDVRTPHLDNIICISLLPTLGKCLETLFINRVNWFWRQKSFYSDSQFGFTPRKSTKDALLRLNNILQYGKQMKLTSVLIFLDFEGAFDNAWWPSILKILKDAGIPHNIYSLLKSFLSGRTAELLLRSERRVYSLEKGCPQGSVSGPTLWNIMNDLLSHLDGCLKIAFADDLLLIFQGKLLTTTLLRAQAVLDFVSHWVLSQKLAFNSLKSKAMIVSINTDELNITPLILDDSPLELVESVNGLTLDDIESEIEVVEDYNKKIIEWKSRITRYLDKNLNSNPQINSHDSRVLSSENSVSSHNTESKFMKLPKLTIEKYYGDSCLWLEFWSQFSNALDSNEHLTPLDKVCYLKSLLGGSAANAVSGFSLTNETYSSAIALLKERFGRTDVVINAHMNKLLNLNPVKNSSNIRALRELYDNCEIQISNLNSLGVASGSYGHLLCPILLKLIPPDIGLEFNRRRAKNSDWDINELITFIKEEIESREMWKENMLCSEQENSDLHLKVLGILWNTASDTFQLDAQPLIDNLESIKSTKRCVLNTMLKVCGPLTASELDNAEMYWIKCTQETAFKVEINQLKCGKSISKEPNLYNLNPDLDENGLLVLKGRLQFSEFQERQKHPWIFPDKSRCVKLLIMDTHERLYHSGVATTLSHLREKYFIIKGKRCVKSVLKTCLICKRFNATPESHGGAVFWETMVRTVKTPLKKILRRTCLTFEEMETTLTEIEAVINSRPLCHIYEQPSEPAHFLVGKRLTSLPHPLITGSESKRRMLTKKLKYRQQAINHFWKRWRKEYLLELRSAYRVTPTESSSFKVK